LAWEEGYLWLHRILRRGDPPEEVIGIEATRQTSERLSFLPQKAVEPLVLVRQLRGSVI